MQLPSQEKTLDLQRGLFLIKYESSENPDKPPKVTVAAKRETANSIDLILPPDVDEPTLWSPGASLVARASGNGRLSVVVSAMEPNGSVAARVQVIPLSEDPLGLRKSDFIPATVDLSEFRVLGHVAGQGDIVVDANHWIAGPLAPARIEGLSIQWPTKPYDLRCRYAVTVGGRSPVMSQFVDAGTFAGTRGRALPLVGATLEIDGPDAQHCKLVVESVFLGSPQTKVIGQRIVLAGPTGREPLVGLRIGIEATDNPLSQPQTRSSAGTERPVERPVGRSRAMMVVERGGKNKPAGVPAPSAKRASGVRVFRSQNRKSRA